MFFLRERYYRYLTEKAEKYSWGRKNDKLFSFESKLSIVFHPSIIGEYLFCLLQIFSTMGLFFQRKLCLKIDQANTTYISKLICIRINRDNKYLYIHNWHWNNFCRCINILNKSVFGPNCNLKLILLQSVKFMFTLLIDIINGAAITLFSTMTSTKWNLVR